MKIGLLSDAHGNPDGVTRCLRHLQEVEEVEALCFLGDAVGYLPAWNEVLAELRSAGVACVLGNHDAMLLGRLPLDPRKDEAYGIEAHRGELTAENRAFLESWPGCREIAAGERCLLLVHGSPWEPLTEYVYPDADFERFRELEFDAVFMGHTHRPLIREAGRVLAVNVGSCGQPRDHGALASCAVYDSERHSVRLVRLPMDVERLCERFAGKIHQSVIDCFQHRRESDIVGEVAEL